MFETKKRGGRAWFTSLALPAFRHSIIACICRPTVLLLGMLPVLQRTLFNIPIPPRSRRPLTTGVVCAEQDDGRASVFATNGPLAQIKSCRGMLWAGSTVWSLNLRLCSTPLLFLTVI